MSIARTLLLIALVVAMQSIEARGFRTIQPIARKESPPAGATAVANMLPVARAVHAVARAWNSGELGGTPDSERQAIQRPARSVGFALVRLNEGYEGTP